MNPGEIMICSPFSVCVSPQGQHARALSGDWIRQTNRCDKKQKARQNVALAESGLIKGPFCRFFGRLIANASD
jgi:hypothetical protein